MAKSVLDIVIRTLKQGGADKETISGLVKMKGAVTQAMGAFAAMAAITYTVDKALDATMGKYLTYGQNVKDASLALGLSADETSRVIALTDDLGISYEDLSAAIKKNADNANYSIEGLANSSAAYLALGDAQDRAKYAQANYGKQWTQFAKLLEKGPDQVRAMAAAVDEGHLFDESDLARVEAYRVSLDEMHDSWEAVSMGIGEKAVPMMIAFNNQATKAIAGWGELGKYIGYVNQASQDALRAEELFKQAGEGYYDEETKAKYVAMAVAEREAATATAEHAAEMEKASDSAQILAVDYDKLLGSIKSMQGETDRFNEAQSAANGAILQANSDFAAGNITLAERNLVLDENKAKLNENAAAHDQWAAQTVFAFAQARAAADGDISEGEGQILISMGEQLGLFDEKTAETMQNVNKAFDNVDSSNAEQVVNALKGQLETLTGKTWVINIATSTDGAAVPTSPTTPASSAPLQGGFATGGAFDAGKPMQVHKDEVLVPDYGGVVLTRTDAMRLMSGNGGDNSKRVTIYGLTIYAQGNVMDELENLK